MLNRKNHRKNHICSECWTHSLNLLSTDNGLAKQPVMEQRTLQGSYGMQLQPARLSHDISDSWDKADFSRHVQLLQQLAWIGEATLDASIYMDHPIKYPTHPSYEGVHMCIKVVMCGWVLNRLQVHAHDLQKSGYCSWHSYAWNSYRFV